VKTGLEPHPTGPIRLSRAVVLRPASPPRSR
jgi:hypothetical protein